MMITSDEPRRPAWPARFASAEPGATAGTSTVRVQLTRHRGNRRRTAWRRDAECCMSSSRCCATRVLAISGCMMPPGCRSVHTGNAYLTRCILSWSLSRYISNLACASGFGARAAAARTGACGDPASSFCRGALTFPWVRDRGSASGTGTRSAGIADVAVAVVAIARQWRCVKDGVPEQHELDRHGTWRATRGILALGETVFLAYRALDRLHELSVQLPGLIRRHVEHARGAAEVVLEALRPGRSRSKAAARAAQHAIQPYLVERLAGQPELLIPLAGLPAQAPVGLTPRTLPALAAARLLHEAVLRQRPQVKSAVRRRLAEHLAGLRRGERPRVAERLEQRPAQRVGQRSHGLRVGQVEMQPIVARPRPILVSVGLSSVSLSSADLVFAGLSSAGRAFADRAFAGLASVGMISVGPIFGSHVSKDY